MTAAARFTAVVSTAIFHTPGGVLLPSDRAGLIKRARSMGIPEDHARQAIAALCDRPRHPVTRGIE